MTRPHIFSYDQSFHVLIQDFTPVFNGLRLAQLEKRLTRQIGYIRIGPSKHFIELIELPVPPLESPALTALSESNLHFEEYDILPIHFLLLERWYFAGHARNDIMVHHYWWSRGRSWSGLLLALATKRLVIRGGGGPSHC